MCKLVFLTLIYDFFKIYFLLDYVTFSVNVYIGNYSKQEIL